MYSDSENYYICRTGSFSIVEVDLEIEYRHLFFILIVINEALLNGIVDILSELIEFLLISVLISSFEVVAKVFSDCRINFTAISSGS
jgi:hypothetical protein